MTKEEASWNALKILLEPSGPRSMVISRWLCQFNRAKELCSLKIMGLTPDIPDPIQYHRHYPLGLAQAFLNLMNTI